MVGGKVCSVGWMVEEKSLIFFIGCVRLCRGLSTFFYLSCGVPCSSLTYVENSMFGWGI